jgi:hypothetical protein
MGVPAIVSARYDCQVRKLALCGLGNMQRCLHIRRGDNQYFRSGRTGRTQYLGAGRVAEMHGVAVTAHDIYLRGIDLEGRERFADTA